MLKRVSAVSLLFLSLFSTTVFAGYSNQSFETADKLTIPAIVKDDYVSLIREEQYYYFIPTQTGTVRIDLLLDDQREDVELKLFNSTPYLLKKDTSGTGDRTINYSVQQGQKYYIVVDYDGTSSGHIEYKLKVKYQ